MEKKFRQANDRCIEVLRLLISQKKAKNMSHIAKRLGVDGSRITHIENHSRNITPSMLFLLYEIFNASSDYILFGVGKPFIEDKAPENTIDELIKRITDLEKATKK